ncbi:hypothetical protein HLB44_29190 [Aquincola sp. S2]|uniref:Response regulatory domain-containing protein n=1 Tax=Pseudaquabacterium terrae TaxID=2732868 RepID=A0ABX2ER99_9BURK|nr:hypothetical protein [Aquabacterium terrae]NRF71084.1 hypothetical protein [Aquabacterium terrae]
MPASNPSTHPLQVILLVAHVAQRQRLRGLLGSIAPRCRVASAASAGEASAHLARERAELLVLELAVAQGRPLALIHHLARVAPATVVVAFDEAATCLPIRPYDVHCWTDAQAALRRAIDALRAAGPQPFLPRHRGTS